MNKKLILSATVILMLKWDGNPGECLSINESMYGMASAVTQVLIHYSSRFHIKRNAVRKVVTKMIKVWTTLQVINVKCINDKVNLNDCLAL